MELTDREQESTLWCAICKKIVSVSDGKCPQECPECGAEIQAEWQTSGVLI